MFCFAEIHRWGQGPIEISTSGPKCTDLHAQNHSWGLGPIETCYSSANYAVLCAQIHRWGQGPLRFVILVLKSLFSMHKTTSEGWNPIDFFAILYTKIHRWGLGPIETCNSGPKCTVLDAQNHRWGLGPIQTCYSRANYDVLCCTNPTDEVRAIDIRNSSAKVAFSMHKQVSAGTHRDLLFWCWTRGFECTNPQVRSGTHGDL